MGQSFPRKLNFNSKQGLGRPKEQLSDTSIAHFGFCILLRLQPATSTQVNFTEGIIMPTKQPNILILWGDDIGIWNISRFSDGAMGYRTPNLQPRELNLLVGCSKRLTAGSPVKVSFRGAESGAVSCARSK
jgi:hypothetical protein